MALLDGILAQGSHSAGPQGIVARSLEAVRQHLGMEVAYISEFVGNDSVFRVVDAPGLEALIQPGDSRSLDDVYCRHILAGRLPELIPDTSAIPLAAGMPITRAIPIGSHVSVPIRLADGSVYGMFCCLSPQTNSSLNVRDLQVMRAFADIAADEIRRERQAGAETEAMRVRLRRVIDEELFSIHFQPIWDFRHEAPVGFECLARFSAEPLRSPDKWFAEAAALGLGLELELAAIRSALAASAALPDSVYVAINAAAETILSSDLETALAGFDGRRIVLELTEHAAVSDYDGLIAAITSYRARGVRLAIDDAGAGYSGLQHIVRLKPDIIKLDMALTRNVDTDPARRALAAALIHFARETDCQILAEGIETDEERTTLKLLGVAKGQGYYLGRPMVLTDAIALCAPASKVA
jgi:EAL domain-containing protein (putative c-di-GMP-specific phosphodiesterase class I)